MLDTHHRNPAVTLSVLWFTFQRLFSFYLLALHSPSLIPGQSFALVASIAYKDSRDDVSLQRRVAAPTKLEPRFWAAIQSAVKSYAPELHDYASRLIGSKGNQKSHSEDAKPQQASSQNAPQPASQPAEALKTEKQLETHPAPQPASQPSEAHKTETPPAQGTHPTLSGRT